MDDKPIPLPPIICRIDFILSLPGKTLPTWTTTPSTFEKHYKSKITMSSKLNFI